MTLPGYHGIENVADKGGKEQGYMEEEKIVQKPKKHKKSMTGVLGVVQHILLAVTVVSLMIVAVSSRVSIEGLNQNLSYYYNPGVEDENTAYEESGLFNHLFGYSVADVVRLGVISSQLETDGSFDGSKVIDVVAYNCRETGLPKQYISVKYFLEDLLKWDSYGFERTVMTTSQEDFLADRTRVTVVDENSKYYNTSDAMYLKSDISQYTHEREVMGASAAGQNVFEEEGEVTEETYTEDYIEEGQEVTEETDGTYDEEKRILVNRYKTVDGKNLEEYVSDWDTYHDMIRNLESAAHNLSLNYEEYLSGSEYYSTANSNVRYLIEKKVGNNTEYYTNLTTKEELEAVKKAMHVKTEFDNADLPAEKYVYYSPADMIYQTNTMITRDTLLKLFEQYDYAYPENVKLWIGVDTTYPVQDAFAQGMESYQNYVPSFLQTLVVACVSGILYLAIFVYLTVRTGRIVDEEGHVCIRLGSFDRIPTEGAACLGVGVISVYLYAVYILLTFSDIMESLQNGIESESCQVSIGLLALFLVVLDVICMFFFYSLVRRIKAKTLWMNSFLYRVIKWLKRGIQSIRDNSSIMLRIWIPYGIYLLFNGFMVVWMMACDHIFPLVIAAVMDLIVGVMLYRDAEERQKIVRGIETIAEGELTYQVEEENLHGDNQVMARAVNNIGKGIKEAVEISMKDERMKTDLITNVSHDIKTPLTSIINYVDLIKREDVENEKVNAYIRVLDEKSQRLKQLTDDLVEASKISSGNIQLHFEKINLTELMNQTIGEFSEKFEEKKLTAVLDIRVQNVVIEADSRRIWRIMENLFNNIYKYALEGTRVYVTAEKCRSDECRIELSIKNISAVELNCNPQELTERFIRGDASRTTEGSGLGLSIARNLTEALRGTFEIVLDGDLFKVVMTFPLAEQEAAD